MDREYNHHDMMVRALHLEHERDNALEERDKLQAERDELLAVLEQVKDLAYYAHCFESDMDAKGSQWESPEDEIYDVAAAAIAKAKGGE